MNLFTLAAAASKAGETAKKAATTSEKSPLSEILLIALVGFITVFVVLVVLMFIISLISKIFSEKKVKEVAPAPKSAEVTAPAVDSDERVDTYTGVKLINVSDKDAALIMAIVADGLDKPLDNLRFISIKEVQ